MERFITKQNLTRLAEELAATCRVLAPVTSGGTVTFRRFQPGMTLDLHSRMAAVSPKAATFPQTETLLVVKREGTEKKPELIETLPQGKSVVIGCRPCGARGKLIFNPVYETDKTKDPYYIQRRDNTVFISLACDRPETTCFCHSVGSGPADPNGSDVLLTLVGEGYVARSVTPEGEELLKLALFEDAGAKGKEADAQNEKAREMMGEAHDYASAPAKLLARFDDMDFWQAQVPSASPAGPAPTCVRPATASTSPTMTWD